MKKTPRKRLKKPRPNLVDGMSEKDIRHLRKYCRQVWSWSYPRKLCIARATDKNGFGVCEQCRKKVPKVYADHKHKVGDVDEGFLKRLFTPSKNLQALCKKCHDKKTRDERNEDKYGF